jgi:nitrite reductase/ring-hydroxylating ferredoxin subunit
MLVRIASLAQLTPGTVGRVEAQGNEYAVCNVNGTVYALDGVCPHAGGSLGEGAVHGHMIVCPWHAWEYDCRTGENDFDPEVRVSTYPVRIDGDDVFLELPADAGAA